MSFAQKQPWSAAEKDALLLALLRALRPDTTTILVRLIEERGVDFLPWLEIALPQGHSVRSCQFAFEEIRRATHQGISQSSAPLSVPSLYPTFQPVYQGQPVGPVGTGKRSWEHEAQHQVPRVIRPRPPRSTDSPKPPVTNGDSSVAVHTSLSEGNRQPLKKRGRPSKEDAERRDKEYAARGETYKPKPRKSKKSENLVDSSLPVTPVENTTEGRRFTTPPHAIFEIREDRSSSKRKRKRQQEGDREPEQVTLASHEKYERVLPLAAQSPSDRLLARGSERGTSATSMFDENTPSGITGDGE